MYGAWFYWWLRETIIFLYSSLSGTRFSMGTCKLSWPMKRNSRTRERKRERERETSICVLWSGQQYMRAEQSPANDSIMSRRLVINSSVKHVRYGQGKHGHWSLFTWYLNNDDALFDPWVQHSFLHTVWWLIDSIIKDIFMSFMIFHHRHHSARGCFSWNKLERMERLACY